MSRTFKDLPYRVRMKKALEAGERNHWHGFPSEYTFEKKEEIRIPKADAAEVHKVREDLKKRNIEFDEHEEPGTYKYSFLNGYDLPRVQKEPKTIVFTTVEEISYESLMSEYCSDPEFYDHRTGLDTRDGKFASCVPHIPYWKRGCSCPWCTDSRTRHIPKNDKSKLEKIAKAYNTGLDIDELYDYEPTL